ncbi:CPBP family intramembrane glutamic endopeptidase [Butyrivibrio sp. MC2013]|uniref:CPBP family intramembrane glutamic endopeptidase n=1 Tax=Butyrivibrio sp. MC2013 TaxID=1280686 RepID=UPI000421C503|nr:type II CAAX endopeptidase family protein [Butyrivibrio sp. MC2013]
MEVNNNNSNTANTAWPDMYYPAARKSYNHIGWTLVAYLIISIVVQVVLLILAPYLEKMNILGFRTEDESLYTSILISMYLIAFPIAYLIGNSLPSFKPSKEKVGFYKLLSYYMMVFPLSFILNIFSSWLADIISGGKAVNAIDEIAGSDSPYAILMVVVIGPLVEELIFRKLMIDKTAIFGEAAAVLFSALCFSLFHMNLYQTFYTFVIGLVFAFIYIRTGRIWITVVFHMFFNFWGSVVPTIVLKAGDEIMDSALSDPAAFEKFISSGDGVSVAAMVSLMAFDLCQLILVVGGIVCIIVNLARKEFTFKPARAQVSRLVLARASYLNAGFIVFAILCLLMTVANLFAS